MDAVASVAGGLFETNGLTSLTQVSTTSAPRRRAAQALSVKGALAFRRLTTILNGAVAGSLALRQIGRIQANSELGGARTIELETLVNRNTTSGDVAVAAADLFAYYTRHTFGASPPANLDGNPLGTR